MANEKRNIVHLLSWQIEKERWDKTIFAAHNSLIYALSYYLDSVTEEWEAIVTEDYEYVMPLTVKRRKGIKYVVQPPLTQQLGIFSAKPITEEITELFVRKIPYLSYSINLNFANIPTPTAQQNPNYTLSLDGTMEEIERRFSTNCKRNINRGKRANCTINEEMSWEEFVDYYYATETHYAKPDKTFTQKLGERLERENALKIVEVRNSSDERVAALAYLHWGGRLIYWLPISNGEGKDSSAMFLIVQYLIEKYAGKAITLDFEGSRIEGIARFYRGFGAENRPYFTIERMRMKWLNALILKLKK